MGLGGSPLGVGVLLVVVGCCHWLFGVSRGNGDCGPVVLLWGGHLLLVVLHWVHLGTAVNIMESVETWSQIHGAFPFIVFIVY